MPRPRNAADGAFFVFDEGRVVAYKSRLNPVHLVAVLTGLMGAVNVGSAITPSLAERLAVLGKFSPLEVRSGSRLAATLAGFALLIVAQSLWRRKRAAWWMTLLLLAVSAIAHLLKGLDWEEATLAGALILWIALLRSRFTARSDRPSVRQGLHVLLWAIVFTTVYGTIGFILLDHHAHRYAGPGKALLETFRLFADAGEPGLMPAGRYARSFVGSLYGVGIGTVGFALATLLRPVVLRTSANAAERERAQKIVEAHGHSSLARMCLFDDKAYWFSPGGSVVAFTVVGRICLALGDPIGPEDDIASVVAGFRDFCAEQDWLPAFVSTFPDYLNFYREAGFHALNIGSEAIVDVQSFSLAGNDGKNLRAAINRQKREGYRTEVCYPPHSPELLQGLRAVSDEWLQGRHGKELRFSLGWFDDAYLQSCPIMVIRGPDESICAFANITPEYQNPEGTIDMMRHRKTAPPGTMDALFIALFEWTKAQNYGTFNIGLCPLAGVGEAKDDPATERAVHFLYQHMNRFYNFKGLRAYKEKFHPRWEPRYLVYYGATSLPAVALALVRAEEGPYTLPPLPWCKKKDED
jgi:phosphatidylglycerol lysyltransferase